MLRSAHWYAADYIKMSRKLGKSRTERSDISTLRWRQ